jgi:hypothetical protein
MRRLLSRAFFPRLDRREFCMLDRAGSRPPPDRVNAVRGLQQSAPKIGLKE